MMPLAKRKLKSNICKNKILTIILSRSFLKTEQKKLAKILINKNIKFICLAGFMKILPAYFVKQYSG